MASSKNKQNLKAYRKSLSALKKAGLISPHIDARSHRPTRHMLAQIKQFRDVIDGRARTVKLPSRTKARDYAGIKRVKFDRVVVKISEGDAVRYDKRDGIIKISRKSHYPDVERYTQLVKPQAADELPNLPSDSYSKVYRYGMPFARGKTIRRIFADTAQELLDLMSAYDPKKGGRFIGWQSYVEILEFNRADLPEDEFEIERDFEDENAGRAAYDKRRNAKAQPRDSRGRFIASGRSTARAKKGAKAARKNGAKRR